MSSDSNHTSSFWAVASFLIGSWLLLAIASYFLLAIPREQRYDFFPRWVGARAVLIGENPYSNKVTLQIQEGMLDDQLVRPEKVFNIKRGRDWDRYWSIYC